jgi:hypothetical protein
MPYHYAPLLPSVKPPPLLRYAVKINRQASAIYLFRTSSITVTAMHPLQLQPESVRPSLWIQLCPPARLQVSPDRSHTACCDEACRQNFDANFSPFAVDSGLPAEFRRRW